MKRSWSPSYRLESWPVRLPVFILESEFLLWFQGRRWERFWQPYLHRNRGGNIRLALTKRLTRRERMFINDLNELITLSAIANDGGLCGRHAKNSFISE